jgi:RHS repeat-associated protein
VSQNFDTMQMFPSPKILPTGNLTSKAGVSYDYNDSTHDHAVTHLSGVHKYWYDANGNQVTRIVGSDTYNLSYDAENRLVEVKKNNNTVATFTYDGDGQCVISTIGTTTTGFVGDHTEWKVGAASQPTRYYNAGGMRLATRLDGVMYYPLTDHLGSTGMTTDASGNQVAEIRYKAWGESRYTYGTQQTKHTYTGQYSNVSDFGLMYYNARWYDPLLSRFSSADTMVPQPGNPQDWDRYGYINNNPVNGTDPTGHFANIFIGAAIGAAVNVGLYMWNEVGNQDGFNWQQDGGDLLCAAIQGAIVGGLIGSGVGAGAGVSVAMSAGLGAASNLVSDQVGNLITGDDYNWATTSIDTAMGAVSGAVTANPGLTSNLVSGGLESVNYMFDTLVTNEQITPMGLMGSFASGFISQAWTSDVEINARLPHYEDYGTGVMTMTYKGASEVEAAILSNTIVPAFQASGESILGRFYDNLLQAQ